MYLSFQHKEGLILLSWPWWPWVAMGTVLLVFNLAYAGHQNRPHGHAQKKAQLAVIASCALAFILWFMWLGSCH
jgi:hypothetical protein